MLSGRCVIRIRQAWTFELGHTTVLGKTVTVVEIAAHDHFRRVHGRSRGSPFGHGRNTCKLLAVFTLMFFLKH